MNAAQQKNVPSRNFTNLFFRKREYLNSLSKFDSKILTLFIRVQRYFLDCAIHLFLASLSDTLVFVAIENGREGLQANAANDCRQGHRQKARALDAKKTHMEKLSTLILRLRKFRYSIFIPYSERAKINWKLKAS